MRWRGEKNVLRFRKEIIYVRRACRLTDRKTGICGLGDEREGSEGRSMAGFF